MNRDVTWILVCNGSGARLFASRGRQAPLNLLKEFDHPEGRAANHDLVSDRAGQAHQRVGPSSSAMEPHTSPKEVAQGHFVHLLANVLHKGLDEKDYRHLVLVASPHLLGRLREALSSQVQQHVRASLDKDCTQLDARALAEQLTFIWEPIAAAH